MRRVLLAVLVLACACGSQTLYVAPVTVQPIHVIVDVNVHAPGLPAANK